jgi:hypothetical protein
MSRTSLMLMLRLLTQTKTPDYRTVALDIPVLHIIEESASLADQLQQTTSGMMVLLVRLEMERQVLYPGAKQGNLHLRRTGIVVMQLVIVDNIFSFDYI